MAAAPQAGYLGFGSPPNSDRDREGRLAEIKELIIDMVLSGSGIRATARVLDISTDTVLNELKQMNRHSAR